MTTNDDGRPKGIAGLITAKPWAIEPAHLDALIEAINGADGVPVAGPLTDRVRAATSYMTVDDDGIATIRIDGVTQRGSDLFDLLFGAVTDTDILIRDLERAAADPGICGVLLLVDSPGGTVDGTAEAAAAVRAAAAAKQVTAFASGTMASAAYWIASGARQIVATQTSRVGSIGVATVHVDKSGLLKRFGLKVTHIAAGKFKRIANDTEPLTDEGREYIKETIVGLYTIFANAVADARGMDAADVFGMESKTYLADAAKAVGLVDTVGDLSTALKTARRGAGIMNKTELKTEHPDLFAEVYQDGANSVDVEALRAEGAADERKRIVAIRESAFPGQDAVVEKLIADGTAVDDARAALIVDQKNRMNDKVAQLEKSDPGDLGANPAGDPAGEAAEADAEATADDKQEAGDKLNDIAKQIKADDGCTYAAAFDKAVRRNPALAKVYFDK